ncbi:hypothetical protein [Sphingomonas sp. PB4P5]|uniref:hypothetical protein n=1 Tax=Parasphingomonas puruogangriensis TaxID=3096155 RepID=UPI002FCAB771
MTVFHHNAGMRSYLAVRRFVDWDLSGTGYIRSGSWSLMIALLLACGPLPFVERPYSPSALTVIALAIGASLIWMSFIAWRGIRIFRVTSIRGDRRYDRHDKHRLSSEYAGTESATKSKHRR